jgi:hypothetical protein
MFTNEKVARKRDQTVDAFVSSPSTRRFVVHMCTLSANPTDKGNPKGKKSFVVTAIWWSLEKNKS